MVEAFKDNADQLSKKQIEEGLFVIKQENKKDENAKVSKFDDLEVFHPILASNDFKVPLTWFLNDVAVFYKCERGDNIKYRRIIPSLKDTFLKVYKDEKPYEMLPKYHLLKQENIDNTFISLEMVKNSCRPTAMDRPPFFECCLKPPICLNNMTFSEISVYRQADGELMHVIKPGGYGYLYTGVETKKRDHDSDEDEKMIAYTEMSKDKKRRAELYEGEVKLNKYVLKFVDDGNVVYVSDADYFFSFNRDYAFYPETPEENEEDEDREEPVVLKFEITNFNYFIYTPYMLINKTDMPIYFGEKGTKYEKARMIAPHTNEFFNPKSSKKKKFSVSVEGYEWAKPFDISTLGMSGEVSLKKGKHHIPYHFTKIF
jgi:hypothetical protein